MLTHVAAIFKRELSSYFDSPLAYIVIPVFLVLVGGFSLYFQDLLSGGLATMRPVFFWSSVFMLLLIPAVTMRLFSEEHRLGSIELLVTLPVSEPAIVLGKFLAAFALVAVAIAMTLTYPITLMVLSDVDWARSSADTSPARSGRSLHRHRHGHVGRYTQSDRGLLAGARDLHAAVRERIRAESGTRGDPADHPVLVLRDPLQQSCSRRRRQP